MQRRWTHSAWAVFALAAACGQPVPPKLGAIEDRIFAPSCTFSSCHSPSGHAGELVLARGQAFAQLVGRAAAQEQAAREGMLRVQPGQPDGSFLLVKLRAHTPAKYGGHMPDGQGQLDAELVTAIEQWIKLGAADD